MLKTTIKSLAFITTAMFTMSSVAQTDTLFAPTEDGYVSNIDSVTTSNPYLWGSAKLGKSDVSGSAHLTSVILPFKLPSNIHSQEIDSVSLNVFVNFGREWIDSNVSLYGLTYADGSETGPGRSISADDYFSGNYGDGSGNGHDVGIVDSFFTKNVPLGTQDVERWETTGQRISESLKAYIEGQVNAGARAGDWIFIRLSIANANMTGSQYFGIDGGDETNPANIFIKYKATTNIDQTLNSGIDIFPNPCNGSNLTLTSSNFGIEKIEMINLSGQVVKTINTKTSHTVSIDNIKLQEGTYLVKLYSANQFTISKIIIN